MLRKTVSKRGSENTCSVTKIRLYSADEELVNIEFCPALYTDDGNVFWDRYDILRIYRSDYEHFFTPVFKEIFPVCDPDPNGWGLQENFDPCSPNWFGRDDWLKIAKLLRERFCYAEEDERSFCETAAIFIERTADITEIFCIEGNL